MTEGAGEPFFIYEKPPYEFAVLKLSAGHYGYFLKFHHTIADGWSIQRLQRFTAEKV